MGEKLVKGGTPMEFFREQLEQAMEHQKVSTSDFVEYYLVNLLSSGVGVEKPPVDPVPDETPLALLYVRAVQSSRTERARLLKSLGDTALFVSGFFADSLHRKLVDFDYYRSMGGFAYGRLAQDEEPRIFGPEVFGELAGRFAEFADLLSEVAEKTRLTSNASILRLYERWIQTGSRRAAALLAERGITPVAAGPGRQQ